MIEDLLLLAVYIAIGIGFIVVGFQLLIGIIAGIIFPLYAYFWGIISEVVRIILRRT